MKIYPFQAIYPRMNRLKDTATYKIEVKERFADYYKDGWYHFCEKPALYIYQVVGGKGKYTGLVTTIDTSTVIEGKVKKHEHTLVYKEQKQMKLFEKHGAQIKPVLLTCEELPSFDDWLEDYTIHHKPTFTIDMEEDGEHRVWQVTDTTYIKYLQACFNAIELTYIADGHHRAASMVNLYEQSGQQVCDKFLVGLFPANHVGIYAFSRVVTDIEPNILNTFKESASSVFDFLETKDIPMTPTHSRELVLYYNQQWHRVCWNANLLQRLSSPKYVLDVDLLEKYIFQELFDIKEVRKSKKIKYFEAYNTTDKLMKTVDEVPNTSIGFTTYPINVQTVMEVTTHDKVLPPKSTWFLPRIKNGVIALKIPF